MTNSFDAEWAGLVTNASASRDATNDPAKMQLNQMAASPGGGGDLVVHSDELGAIGNLAYGLRQRLHADGDFAQQATQDAASSLTGDGVMTGPALDKAADCWKTQVRTMAEAFAHISNHLDYSKSKHAEDEEKVKTSMRDAEGRLMSVSRIYDLFK